MATTKTRVHSLWSVLIACKVQACLNSMHRLANVVIYGGANGVRLEVIGVKTHHVLFAQEWLNFAASGKVGGEVCVVIFGPGLGFVKRSLSHLESLNFKIYRIA